MRRFADAALALEAYFDDELPPVPPVARTLADQLDATLVELAAAAREHRAPSGLPPLRNTQQELAALVGPAMPLAEETDRMVNSLAIAAHVLEAPATDGERAGSSPAVVAMAAKQRAIARPIAATGTTGQDASELGLPIVRRSSCKLQGDRAVWRIRSNGIPAASATSRTASSSPSNRHNTTRSSRIIIDADVAHRQSGGRKPLRVPANPLIEHAQIALAHVRPHASCDELAYRAEVWLACGRPLLLDQLRASDRRDAAECGVRRTQQWAVAARPHERQPANLLEWAGSGSNRRRRAYGVPDTQR